MVVAGVPGLVTSPLAFPFFWIIVALVAYQYRRVAETERRIYGVNKNQVFRHVLISVGYGLFGGLLASLIMAFLGASLSGTGIYWLLPLALLLMAINPRLMCFSYAGGLVSVSFLLFGWPKVHVPSLMALVAVLHVTESVLIFLRGASCATPLVIRAPGGGRTRPGFALQAFWPLPLLLLFVVTLPPGASREGLMEMPSWWPLVAPPPDVAAQPEAVFTLFPVAAVLGYSDLATRFKPADKARRSALALLAYSVILAILSVAASRYSPLVWLAALWGPLGHEAVIRLGSRGEFRAAPALERAPDGLTVMDTLPGGGALRAGLRPGDVLLEVAGVPTADAATVAEVLAQASSPVEVRYRRGTAERTTLVDTTGGGQSEQPLLGLIPLPPEDAPPQVEIRSHVPACSFLRGLLARRKRGRRD